MMGLLLAHGMDPQDLFHRYSFDQLDFIARCLVRREITRVKLFGSLFGVKFKDEKKEPDEMSEEEAKRHSDIMIAQLSQLQTATRKLRR